MQDRLQSVVLRYDEQGEDEEEPIDIVDYLRGVARNLKYYFKLTSICILIVPEICLFIFIFHFSSGFHNFTRS